MRSGQISARRSWKFGLRCGDQGKSLIHAELDFCGTIGVSERALYLQAIPSLPINKCQISESLIEWSSPPNARPYWAKSLVDKVKSFTGRRIPVWLVRHFPAIHPRLLKA
jgi:hypothetical protein